MLIACDLITNIASIDVGKVSSSSRGQDSNSYGRYGTQLIWHARQRQTGTLNTGLDIFISIFYLSN